MCATCGDIGNRTLHKHCARVSWLLANYPRERRHWEPQVRPCCLCPDAGTNPLPSFMENDPERDRSQMQRDGALCDDFIFTTIEFSN